MSRNQTLAAALLFALAGCGGETASAPGAVSPGEAKALEDAAEMLEERRLPPDAVPTEVPTAPPSSADLTGDGAAVRP